MGKMTLSFRKGGSIDKTSKIKKDKTDKVNKDNKEAKDELTN